MDRYKEGYNDCNREWENRIKKEIDKLKYDIEKTKEIKQNRYEYDKVRLKAYITKSKEIIQRLQDLLKKG